MAAEDSKTLLEREIARAIQSHRTESSTAPPSVMNVGGVIITPHVRLEDSDTIAVREAVAEVEESRLGLTRLVEDLVRKCDEAAKQYKKWETFVAEDVPIDILENYPNVIERLRARYTKAVMPTHSNWSTHLLMDMLGMHDGLSDEVPDYD